MTRIFSAFACLVVFASQAVSSTVYVDASSASPASPYGSWETAAATLTEGVAAAKEAIASGEASVEIRVATGTYTENSFALDCPVSIVGDTGDPADVRVVNSTSGVRAFTISNGEASLKNITVSGTGLQKSYGSGTASCGGHIHMTAGLVENCVISGGYAANTHNGGWGRGFGGNVYITGGKLSRCVIKGGRAVNFQGSSDVDNRRSRGAGVYAGGGAIVENCLIYGNGNSYITYGGGVYVDGSARVVNCTIADNVTGSSYPGSGVYIGSASARVVNSVMYGNGGTAFSEFGNANLSLYSYCASSVTNENSETWKIVDAHSFAGIELDDYRILPSSGLDDAATASLPYEWSGNLDLAGKPRLSGAAVDIGCYEIDKSVLSCAGLPLEYAQFVFSPYPFKAAASGGSGTYVFRWDFGNGEVVTTESGVYEYAYPTSGLFNVTLRVSDDAGATWSASYAVPVQVRVVPKTVYVDSSNASPEYPYDTREKAANKILDCFNAMTNNASAKQPFVDGAEIRILPGPHVETGLKVVSGVIIAGDTGNPADVVISDSVVGSRAFTMSDKDAVIRDLTVSGTGFQKSYGSGTASCGGHIHMTAGLVENCVISGGYAANTHNGGWGRGFGGNVYITGGKLSRCVIKGGRAVNFQGSSDVDNRRSRGAGVYAGGSAIVENCLIYGNGNSYITYGGGVYVDGSARVVNCTIADNVTGSSYPGSGVYIGSASARVVNSVMYGNGGTAFSEFGNANLSLYSYCASSVTNENSETWKIVEESDFTGYLSEDYHPVPTGAFVDGGTLDTGISSSLQESLDLDGNMRLSGGAVDIGCYEIDQTKVQVAGSLSTYKAFSGGEITLTASAAGGSGVYSYRWDLGNGDVLVTDEESLSYAFPTSGLFTVSVSVSADGGETWSEATEIPSKIVVAPEVMYVDSANANPLFPYDTKETAANKIADCLNALTNTFSGNLAYVDGVEIRVLPGPHTETGLKLSSAVTVAGDTGDPADVVIEDGVSGSRAFTITHPGAVIRDLTVSGTGLNYSNYGSSPSYGGHIHMSCGLVENCILSEGRAGGNSRAGWGRGLGGNIYMTGGRLLRSLVTGGCGAGFRSGSLDSGHRSFGGGIYAGGTALVDSCLVKNNGNGSHTYGVGVCLADNATMVNSTIVNNDFRANDYGAGVYISSSTAAAINCVMYANGGTADFEFGNVNRDRYVNCASSVTNESCATWFLIDETAFTGYHTDDFHPTATGVLVNNGTIDPAGYPALSGESDFDGLRRISGVTVDIGCYEVDMSKVTYSGFPSTYTPFTGKDLVFTASAIGGSGSYLYRWDFGNGTVVETAEKEFLYAYPTSGLYYVSLAVSDDGGMEYLVPFTIETQVVSVPETMYVDSANPDPRFPYDTRETAANKIADCLNAMTNNVSGNLACVPGAVIRVLPGSHPESGLVLATSVTIAGDTGDPADVAIVDARNGMRAFTIKDEGAVVRDLTVSGTGYNLYPESWSVNYYGGHIYMTAGLVENCVITGGRAANGNRNGHGGGHGGNVYMTGGRLSRSRITAGQANTVSVVQQTCEGNGISATGGVIENCFIDGNGNTAASTVGSGLYVGGPVKVVNCTFKGNSIASGKDGAGIYVNSSSARVLNCLFYDNGGTAEKEFGGVNGACFDYCASTVTNESCATWRVIPDGSVFVDAGGGMKGFRPKGMVRGNPLVDGGCSFEEYSAFGADVSRRDISGGDRMTIHAMDIGCFEARWPGTVFRVR